MTITIKNFQSHQETQLEIKEGAINAIVGPSRSGKSAIFRALESLCLNSPIDRRDGSKETEVSWRGVGRKRSNTINQYETPDGIFKALRTGVPRQVTDKLRIKEINFRPQHQPYFLLNESPGAVARAMNEWADLGMIDFVAQKLRHDKSEVESLIGTLVETKEQKVSQIEALSWAQEADKRLREVEVAVEAINQAHARIESLALLLDQIEPWEQKPIPDTAEALALVKASIEGLDDSNLRGLASVLEGLAQQVIPLDPRQALENLSGVVLDRGQLNTLSALLDEVKAVDEDLAACPNPVAAMARIEKVQITQADEKLTSVLDALAGVSVRPDPKPSLALIKEAIETLGQTVFPLASTLDLCYKSKIDLEGLEAQESQAREEFNTVLAEAGQCPLCGR